MRRLVFRLRDIGLTLAILVLLALIVLRVEMAGGEGISGSARVIDGDTLTIGGERLRLSGIDAPELRQTCGGPDAEWPCGLAARDKLRTLVDGRETSCVTHGRDRYQRLLGVCHRGDIEINETMVADGLAVAYGSYGGAERRARDAGAGVWAGPFEPPRDWRARHGGLAEPVHESREADGGFLRRLLLFFKK